MKRPTGIMVRFDGIPYFDGDHFRCPDCNGFVTHGICQTCGHRRADAGPVLRLTEPAMKDSKAPRCADCKEKIYFRGGRWWHFLSGQDHVAGPVVEA